MGVSASHGGILVVVACGQSLRKVVWGYLPHRFSLKGQKVCRARYLIELVRVLERITASVY